MYHGTIIQIDDCLVSEEILTEYFACDYEKCKGCCCVTAYMITVQVLLSLWS